MFGEVDGMKLISGFGVCFLASGMYLSSAGVSAIAAAQVSLRKPPASLQQWYKPDSKRQVWLHTMFRLRREMQAITEYSKTRQSTLRNQAVLEKWIARLDKDYNKIADMVPEWAPAIKPRLLPELTLFTEKGDAYRTAKTLKMIRRTCDDCHTLFQPLVTATYRSPAYDDIQWRDSEGNRQNYEDNMVLLSSALNRVLIALDDQQNMVALQASRQLEQQLQNLGESCRRCHKKDDYPYERVLGKATRQRFDLLRQHIQQRQLKHSQKLMGEIAVNVCARCHNIHRVVSDLRNALIVNDSVVK